MTATHDTGSTAALPRWSRVLRVAAARAFLTVLASLLLWAVAPAALGWQPQLILTGSMMPRIAPGDVVVTRTVEPTTVKPGQVVTVDDPDHPGRTRTHRIARIDDEGRLVLRGDANEADDSSPVQLTAVHGVGVLRVPYVGRPLLWLAQGAFLHLGVFLAALAWAMVTVLRDHERSPSEGGGSRSGGTPPDGGNPPRQRDPRDTRPSGPARGRRARAGAGLAAMVLGASVLGAAPATAAFAAITVNPTSSFSAAPSFLRYRDSVLADQPFLYWRLEEAGGTAVADASGNGRAATLDGVPRYGVAGALASAPQDTAFTLTGQRMTQNSSITAPNVFSIEAWIRTTSTSGGRVVGFGNGGGATNSDSVDRHLYIGSDGRAYFGVGNGKKVVSSPDPVNNGAWHHLVATYGGTGANGMKLYVDGVLVGQGNGSVVNLTGFWRAGGDVMSGWPANPTTSWFVGSLDEVAIYPAELTPAAVAEHYDRAF